MRYIVPTLIAACMCACADDEPTRVPSPAAQPRVTLPDRVTASPLPCGEAFMRVVTLDAQGKVHIWSPPVKSDAGTFAGTVLLRVDRAAPWYQVESLFRDGHVAPFTHTIRIAYRGKGARSRFLPCLAENFYLHRDADRYEFEVLRIRLVLQADGSGRCGEAHVDSSRVSEWCTSLHDRAAREKADGLVVELEAASECPWGRIATVLEQLRAGGVSTTMILVRLSTDANVAMSTGGVEFNIVAGDASTAKTRRDEFTPWFPWHDPDDEPLDVLDPPALPD